MHRKKKTSDDAARRLIETGNPDYEFAYNVCKKYKKVMDRLS